MRFKIPLKRSEQISKKEIKSNEFSEKKSREFDQRNLINEEINTYRFEGKYQDPFSDGITQSLLSAFMQCKNKAKHIMQGIKSKEPNKHLIYGSYIHFLHENYIKTCINLSKSKSKNDHSDYFDIFSNIVSWIQRKYDIFLKLQEEIEDRLPDKIKEYLLIASISFEQYIGFYNKHYKNFIWKEVESKFNTPYYSDHFKLTNLEPIRLKGMIDGIFQKNISNNKSDNETEIEEWILETKSKTIMNEESIIDLLANDFQVQIYILAYWNQYGKYPNGCLYNILRKPQLRQGKKENISNFLNRIREDIQKRPEHYYIQYEITFNPKELDKFRRNFENLLGDFLVWYQDLKMGNGKRHYLNFTACETKYGLCEYFNLCSKNEKIYYKISNKFNPELEV